MKAYVYCLCDPDTDEVRYVGSSTNPRQRLRQHSNPNSPHPVLYKWIAEVRSSGKDVVLKIVQEHPHFSAARYAEEELIAEMAKKYGTRLLNRYCRLTYKERCKLFSLKEEIANLKEKLERRERYRDKLIAKRDHWTKRRTY